MSNRNPDRGIMMRAMSYLLDRSRIAQILGKQFSGERNTYAVFGYPTTLEFRDFVAKYVRQDIAARVVDAPADGIWQNPPAVVGSEQFNTAWKDLVRKYNVWNTLARTDKLAALGGYSGLMLGMTGRAASRPSRSRLLYLQPVSVGTLKIHKIERDLSNERYNLPVEYQLSLDNTDDPVGGQRTVGTKMDEIPIASSETLHWARVIHVVENPLENLVYGAPRLARIFNLLEDLLKIVGGTGEAYWMTAYQGMQVDVDPEMTMDPTDAAALEDEIDEYVHSYRRFIRTRGVKINPLGAKTPDPSGPFETTLSLISGATGIPKRILLGAEAGQLASEQDRANWADRLRERQNSFAEPIMLRPFVDRMIEFGVLPDSDYQVRWPDTFKQSPLERGQTSAQMARAVTNMAKGLESPSCPVTREEARNMLWLPAENPDLPEETDTDVDNPAGIPEPSRTTEEGDLPTSDDEPVVTPTTE